MDRRSRCLPLFALQVIESDRFAEPREDVERETVIGRTTGDGQSEASDVGRLGSNEEGEIAGSSRMAVQAERDGPDDDVVDPMLVQGCDHLEKPSPLHGGRLAGVPTIGNRIHASVAGAGPIQGA